MSSSLFSWREAFGVLLALSFGFFLSFVVMLLGSIGLSALFVVLLAFLSYPDLLLVFIAMGVCMWFVGKLLDRATGAIWYRACPRWAKRRSDHINARQAKLDKQRHLPAGAYVLGLGFVAGCAFQILWFGSLLVVWM